MRILKIIGVVASAHVALFMLIFAIPGCRSGAGNVPVANDPAPDAPPVSYASSSAPLISPAPSGQPAGINATQPYPESPRVSGGSNTGGVRSSPSRPSAVSAPVMVTPTPTEAPDLTPAVTYTVVGGDSLWRIAQKHGTTVRELASANNISESAGLQIGQKLIIPTQGTSQVAASSEPAAAPAGPTYTVRPGDSLGLIARRNNVSVSALRSVNGISGDLVRVGQILRIPAEASSSTQPAPAASAPVPAAAAPSGGVLKHVVAPGESLSIIAARYGVGVGEIALANHVTDPRTLQVGQELIIPGWQAPPGAASSTIRRPAPAPSPAAAPSQPQPSGQQNGTVDLRIPGSAQDFTPAADNVPIIRVIDPDAPQGE